MVAHGLLLDTASRGFKRERSGAPEGTCFAYLPTKGGEGEGGELQVGGPDATQKHGNTL